MIDVNNVLDRIKHKLDIKHDSNLGRVFKVSRNTIYSWRSRNTIDFPKLFEITQEHGFNTDIILFGRPGPCHCKSGQDSKPSQKQTDTEPNLDPSNPAHIISHVIQQTDKDVTIDIKDGLISITYPDQ